MSFYKSFLLNKSICVIFVLKIYVKTYLIKMVIMIIMCLNKGVVLVKTPHMWGFSLLEEV